ncbi:thiamine pyrophosphate-dependent dehydrogenase E1 component subunit alpha [Arthrobacter sp. 260]|uniref:thiamine pyrophosphate-dependent dehydrogenase E1 component subunit alpha n=1 Tax=Arthrobacter sp. 260 TaxID=2735314 RepID=UPI00149245B5|nr:thiamine pyrophosphate-dependent dehydrogenase E1 component subunit alpha [Arthrobacter sp. 260]NOJ59168.1 thiamine pyrophosphate-dependent dehydrogenase E1 component subunit alpha [Arthrobacter sp. 260]
MDGARSTTSGLEPGRTDGVVTGPPQEQPAMVQLLTEDGHLVPDDRFGDFAPDPATYPGLYRDMFLIRRFDQESTALQRQGQLALWVPLTGQEAAQIGSGWAMQAADYAFPTYREHGVALTRGVDLPNILRLFRGTTNGGWDPREHNFQLYTLVLAAQTLHAVGYAMGIQRDRAADPDAVPAAAVAYFGDGASSEGDVHEAMVFAASFNAPVVFFCQNNHWAISVPSEVQTRVPLAERAAGYGFPGVRVDGNDILAVNAVTAWALDHARRGKGPVLIEAFTYRMSAHTTADDPTKYRASAEEESWVARDPLRRLESHLRATGTPDSFFTDLEGEAVEQAARLRKAVLAMEAPDLSHRFGTAYAEPHPLVQEELRQWRDYEAGFAPADEGGK